MLIPPVVPDLVPLDEDYENAAVLLTELDGSPNDRRTVADWLVAERQQCLRMVEEYARSTIRTAGERSLALVIMKRITEYNFPVNQRRPSPMTDTNTADTDRAKQAYEAYCSLCPEQPAWDELEQQIRDAWVAAARAVANPNTEPETTQEQRESDRKQVADQLRRDVQTDAESGYKK